MEISREVIQALRVEFNKLENIEGNVGIALFLAYMRLKYNEMFQSSPLKVTCNYIITSLYNNNLSFCTRTQLGGCLQ